MRRLVIVVMGLAAAIAGVAVFALRAPTEAKQQPAPAATQSTDEAAIRVNIEAFGRAYNAKEATAIAVLFTNDGKIISKEGREADGRDKIAAAFAEIFKSHPKKQIAINVDSIKFIGSELAVETGTTRETGEPGELPDIDRYTVLHVKRDGKWQMALARDEEGPECSCRERLEPLSWLIGEWIDDGGSAVIASKCRWSEDGNYLLQEFDLKIHGQDAMKVSQRIGWDPWRKQIRSWVFDSEGGFGESSWIHDGDEWIIKATGVRPDGSTGSATNRLIPTGTDGYVWRSQDRIVGDEVQPDMEVKVVRKPPLPK
ncbi:MAG: YybH family protein [Gemmataceae bacterium]